MSLYNLDDHIFWICQAPACGHDNCLRLPPAERDDSNSRFLKCRYCKSISDQRLPAASPPLSPRRATPWRNRARRQSFEQTNSPELASLVERTCHLVLCLAAENANEYYNDLKREAVAEEELEVVEEEFKEDTGLWIWYQDLWAHRYRWNPPEDEEHEDISFLDTHPDPEGNSFFQKLNSHDDDLGKQENKEFSIQVWKDPIFSVAVPPDELLVPYTQNLEIVGFGEGVKHEKLASGDEGKDQFVAIFNGSNSIDGDLLEVVNIGVFSRTKTEPTAVAWEVYGRDNDKVTYPKPDAEWAFGKITAYRTVAWNGGKRTQWHLWLVLTLQLKFFPHVCIFN